MQDWETKTSSISCRCMVSREAWQFCSELALYKHKSQTLQLQQHITSFRTIFKQLQQSILPGAEHLEWQGRRDSPQWSSGQGSGQPSPSPHRRPQLWRPAPQPRPAPGSRLAELLGHAAGPKKQLLDPHFCFQKTHTVSSPWVPSLQTACWTQ